MTQLLVVDSSPRVRRYDPSDHRLDELAVKREAAADFMSDIEQFLEPNGGSVLWFVSDVRRIGARYGNPQSLVWRDAGVLLGHVCLVAEALGLSCCPLGFLGQAHVSAMFGVGDADLCATGTCLIGRR